MKSFVAWPNSNIDNIKVVDGDTLKFSITKEFRVRLARIDCKEKKDRDAWTKAKEYVKNKIEAAKEVKIIGTGLDNWKRLLVEVFIDGNNLNNELMQKGLAVKYEFNKKRVKRKDSKVGSTDTKKK